MHIACDTFVGFFVNTQIEIDIKIFGNGTKFIVGIGLRKHKKTEGKSRKMKKTEERRRRVGGDVRGVAKVGIKEMVKV